MKLTKNYELEEMFVSSSFPELAKQLDPSRETIDRLKLMTEMVLDPLKRTYGKPVILSAYRDDTLNAKVGGSINSDHRYGAAVRS